MRGCNSSGKIAAQYPCADRVNGNRHMRVELLNRLHKSRFFSLCLFFVRLALMLSICETAVRQKGAL